MEFSGWKSSFIILKYKSLIYLKSLNVGGPLTLLVIDNGS